METGSRWRLVALNFQRGSTRTSRAICNLNWLLLVILSSSLLRREQLFYVALSAAYFIHSVLQREIYRGRRISSKYHELKSEFQKFLTHRVFQNFSYPQTRPYTCDKVKVLQRKIFDSDFYGNTRFV